MDCFAPLAMTAEGNATRAYHRSSGGISVIRAECAATSSRSNDRCTRLADGGCFPTDTPTRHSLFGRIGRLTKPPPQFGQTLNSFVSTQPTQNVHSEEQIRASLR